MIQAQQTVAPFVAQMFSSVSQTVQVFWLTQKFGLSTYPLLCSMFKSDEELALLKQLMSEAAISGLASQSGQAIQAWLFKTQYRQEPDGSWSVSPMAQAYAAVKSRFDEVCDKGGKPDRMAKSFKTEAGFLWKDVCREVDTAQRAVDNIGKTDVEKLSQSSVVALQGQYVQQSEKLEYWKIRQQQAKLICLLLQYPIK